MIVVKEKKQEKTYEESTRRTNFPDTTVGYA